MSDDDRNPAAPDADLVKASSAPLPSAEAPSDQCDWCGSTDLWWRNCKLLCRNCLAIVKSCADL